MMASERRDARAPVSYADHRRESTDLPLPNSVLRSCRRYYGPPTTIGDTYLEPSQNGSATGPTALLSAPHITASAPGPLISRCLSTARSLRTRSCPVVLCTKHRVR